MAYLTKDDGTRIWFEDTGVRDGPVIVFAHEFGGDPRSWNDQVAFFSESHRCIRYAARGFAPSDIPADKAFYGQDCSTRDLEQLADHLKLERFHLAGCSMGSFTSLMFACRHPRRLVSLTLTGISSGPDTPEEHEAYRAYITGEIAMISDDLADGTARWFTQDPANATFIAKHPQRWAAYLERAVYQPHHGALLTVSTLHRDRISLRSVEEQIAAIEASVLLIWGDADLPGVHQASTWLAETLPHGWACVVEGAGHLVQVEEPERFNVELGQLLKETNR
ncbi:MAG: alpha/beta hydrolase [Alphaproteobacteria bacterium]|jgi:pimeloyl-ACP methyl ester carboxylesterase|nr:alpha/beta hydrolase [Rhodospirillaceae bacterium]MDG2480745.1 alpha/beta hydrolase [Alphaproteobacteria bacterium]MBT6205822.1 alpha/beta hydrolase [Rhodospirillaceae bacterium]MBT6510647.1 alpha/beta hydrolase [Rhodospirillaceae bacterium]MBT7611717.1 alpha/beta hydrolase [Rhodospirillaceae bacterium]